ncbi:DUF805 domain-containing protein [Oceaniglobus trochenteri]|uniref:DUF805 domain-containing protein n=1 Tax=Oceaniglobus trochenteri TaxID=2763260 RepID=UPI001CFFB59D|nr:DUF805 domain-containing protein [Oceaniglobus trochenteri]
MTFQQSVKTCFRKYFTFSGRAPRSEYWWFMLFIILASIVLGVLDALVFGAGSITTTPDTVAVESDGPLASLFSLIVLIPTLSAGWRRMHDTGRSGFYLLYPLIVTIGISMAIAFFGGFGMFDDGTAGGLAAIILVPAMIVLAISPLLVLWWLTRRSQPGTNVYGPNPHEVQQ